MSPDVDKGPGMSVGVAVSKWVWLIPRGPVLMWLFSMVRDVDDCFQRDVADYDVPTLSLIV